MPILRFFTLGMSMLPTSSTSSAASMSANVRSSNVVGRSTMTWLHCDWNAAHTATSSSGATLGRERRLGGRGQDEQAAVVAGQDRPHHLGVAEVHRGGGVDDGLLRRDAEEHGDVAELDVGVDERGRFVETLRHADGDVDRDRALPYATLGENTTTRRPGSTRPPRVARIAFTIPILEELRVVFLARRHHAVVAKCRRTRGSSWLARSFFCTAMNDIGVFGSISGCLLFAKLNSIH